ncbi:hypothetical protein B0J18DRAFT_110292 [Chaetomium sp. MPI-SDFR-AT-0129]|nr:hypothetical protein B0J18DRAFT_110292 [Chaetomium sp. MPI-SDFR-AT-0129]
MKQRSGVTLLLPFVTSPFWVGKINVASVATVKQPERPDMSRCIRGPAMTCTEGQRRGRPALSWPPTSIRHNRCWYGEYVAHRDHTEMVCLLLLATQ